MGNSFKTCLSLGTQSLTLSEDDEGVYNPTIRGWCHLYTHRTGYTVYLITYICLISLWFSCRQIYRSSHGCHLSRKNMLVNLPIPWSICVGISRRQIFQTDFFFGQNHRKSPNSRHASKRHVQGAARLKVSSKTRWEFRGGRLVNL